MTENKGWSFCHFFYFFFNIIILVYYVDVQLILNFTSFNVPEYVDFWFDTIHCHRSVEPPEDEAFNEFIDPPVILVLTGKDKCGKVIDDT